ncbi:MAG: AmmeMemoRadiSam system radical SAM enzyme [Aquificaceae bacterium]|nr:AmmeMemoRadiSam system radical SAM enzyme [Aquificaceae bacterium]MDW8422865.1 AmmeMemoRadiSam system radical SAM enzyme [Aquificaceae bacterium]
MERLAWLSEKKDGKVLCKACHQRCVLAEGEFGKCGVRVNRNGNLYLTVYGLVSAMNVDPIEKKPLYHFLPGTFSLSIGTVGCNFSCKFCQNWEISQYPQTHQYKVFGKKMHPEEVVKLAQDYGTPSISYTYNEPVIFFEFSYDVMRIAKEKGIRNVFVTSGYETEEAIDTALPYLDAMNIDLKSFSDEFYKKICGARLKPVLKTIEYAFKRGIWIEITTLLIPGYNDSEEEIREIARFIAGLSKDIPWHVSRFFPAYRMLDVMPTPLDTLERAYHIGKEEGLNFVYVGNYWNVNLESTYCPSCGERVIERHQYRTLNFLKEGKCPKCGYSLPGVWA